MLRTDRYAAIGVLLAAAFLAACEPASVTEARSQLRRGGARTTSIVIPVAKDTFSVIDLLPAGDTTIIGGLVGLKFDADSVTVDVGNKLQFNNLAFSAFNFSFNQMLQTTQQAVAITFPAPPVVSGAPAADVYPAPPPPTTFATPGGSSVQSATIGAGYVVRTFTNGTGCDVTVNTSLTDNVPTVIASFLSNVVVADGTTLLDSISAAGVTVNGFAQVDGNASVGVCVPTSPNISVGVTFRPLTLSQVTLQNVNESFNQTFNAFASEPRIAAVDTVFVSTGSFSITVQNRLPIADNITVRLNGVTKAGVVQQQNIVVPAANGTGGTTSATLTFDLAGARIIPAAVIPQVTGTATATTATITPTNATNATVVTGGGSIVVQSLSGALNPATTPELSITTENTDEFTRAQIDFKDFEDAVRLSHINNATVNLTVVNSAQVPLTLTNFKLGVVRLDGAGQPIRVGGQLDYERDGAGNQILVSVVDPGQTTLTVARGQTKTVALNAALLIDTLVHKLLNNTRIALAVTGGATIGDGAASRISRTDVIKVRSSITIGLDLTLPVAGVTFKRKQITKGANLDVDDADEFALRLDKVSLIAAVTNGTPFGVTVQISLVRDSSALTVDGLLALPACGANPTPTCRVTLVSVVVPGGTVNASGQVVTPASGNVEVSLSGTAARALFGEWFATAMVIQLVPGTGGGGRGAIRPTDQLIVNAKAQVDIKSGGG